MVLACAAALALSACGGPPPGHPAIAANARRLTCVNPASGASWSVQLDPVRRLADGHPADIETGRISWSDPADNAGYELETGSGRLTVTRASSTGGYMVLDRCSAVAP